MGRVLDARAESPRGLLGPGSKPGGGWRPPAGGPEGHALTSGALKAPRDQVNTESATSLQTEEDESETQPTRAGWAPRPKRSAQNSAHRGHTAQWRDGQQAFQRPHQPRRTRGNPRIWVEPVPDQCCPQTHSRSNVEPSPSLRDPGGVGGSTPCGSVPHLGT